MTADSFQNAIATLLAISGSINCIKHMQATAIETGVDVDIYQMVNDLGKKVPVLSAVQPNGDVLIDEFEAAGGARAMLKQLESLLKTNALTVTGRTLADNLKDVKVKNEEVIRPLDRPYSTEAPIVILKGSLAPESAVIKLGIRDATRKTKFRGPAVVFDNGPAAIQAIKDGKIKRGDALVVRGMGLKGGPGMAGPASHVVFALDSADMQSDVAFVSDGQLSGLCNKGLTIAETSPEAAVGGPLSLVENGDMIVIDVDKGQLDLDVPADVLARRREAKGEVKLPKSSGYLSIYQRAVQDMHTGAVLVEK
jgi:dihydroxy-acid dehydratase